MFNTSMMPRELPHIYIVDPNSEPVSLTTADGSKYKDLCGNPESYVKKHQGFVFNISQPGKELKDIIDKFLDEKLDHHFVTDDRS